MNTVSFILLLFTATTAQNTNNHHHHKKHNTKGTLKWPKWTDVQSSLTAASNTFVRATESVEDFIFGESCPYVNNPADAVRKKLTHGLKAQPMVIQAVSDHIQGWYSTNKPLVLAFTGPTGVGKTETATLVAEALLKKKIRMSRRGRMISKGLLVFQGADFADDTVPRKDYHARITSQFAKVLRKCGNHAVVIFDEVQKVAAGTLDVLMEAMSEHPRLTYYNSKTQETETFDTSKVVFILITDVGGDRMFELILEKNGRELITKSYVQKEIRTILRKQWDRLQFTRVVSGNVPFLPLEQEHIREILEFKMQQLNHQGIKKHLWKRIEWTPEFVNHVTTVKNNKYIKYIQYETTESKKRGYASRIFAKYGARNIMNDGPLDGIKTQLLKIKGNDANMVYQFDVEQKEEKGEGQRKRKQGETHMAVRLDRCKEISTQSGNECADGSDGSTRSSSRDGGTCRLLCDTKFKGDLND